VSLRAAGSYRLDLWSRVDLTFHAGAGFEPTMLKSVQQGRSNLVDGDKVLFGFGGTLSARNLGGPRGGPPLLRALRFGAGLSTQVVLPYAQDKRVCASTPCPPGTVVGPDPKNPGEGIDNPGFPRLTGQGTFLSLSFGLGVEL